MNTVIDEVVNSYIDKDYPRSCIIYPRRGSMFSFQTLCHYMMIFKSGKDHPQYYTARNFLRHVYGRSFIDTEYHENPEKFINSAVKFYEELWAEDSDEPDEIVEYPIEKTFDSMAIMAEWLEQHPELKKKSSKQLAMEYEKENNICVIDSIFPDLPKETITTAVSNDEDEIIGNNREARRKREIKKNRHKKKYNWRLK